MNKYKVPFVDFPAQYKKIEPLIDEAIHTCLTNGDYVLRQDVKVFEESLARYVGTKYAVGVNSGTDALFLSLKAAGVGPGDEVITVSHTFIATIEAIVRCGAKPILIDVDQDMLMDCGKLRQAMGTLLRCKAIIPVHFAGRMANMPKIMEMAKAEDIAVIEDAAQALGASIVKKWAGSFGLTGCFSFYPAKVLGGIGDGGAVTTDSKEIADKIRLLRNHWGIKDQKHTGPIGYGYNSRLDNIQAAVLNVKLKYLDDYIAIRRSHANIYHKHLRDMNDIILPSQEMIDEIRTYQDFIIRCRERDQLAQHLKKKGIEVLVRDTTPNHLIVGLGLQPDGQIIRRLPITEQIAKEALRLPIVPELSKTQIRYVIAKIKEFYGSK